jgi:hypothetical protein
MPLHRCCLFPLPFSRWLFVKFACAQFGQQAILFDCALKRRMATSNGSFSFTRMIVIFQ